MDMVWQRALRAGHEHPGRSGQVMHTGHRAAARAGELEEEGGEPE